MATGESSSSATAPARRGTVPARLARALVVAAVVLALLTAGVLVWTVTSRSWVVGDREVAGDQEQVQAQRDELMEVGRQFVLRLGTYGPEGLDAEDKLTEYGESVGELLTPGFRDGFSQSLPLVEQQVADSGVARSAEVLGTGVAEMSEDDAAVLVAGTFTDSLEGEPVGQPVPLRLRVELVRVDGEWLVDDFAGVSPPAEEEQPIDPDLPIPSQEPGGQQGGQQGQQDQQGGQQDQQGGGR